MTPGIRTQIECHYPDLFIVMLYVIMLSVVMLNVTKLSVVMLNVEAPYYDFP
jgi:hypothetical protein